MKLSSRLQKCFAIALAMLAGVVLYFFLIHWWVVAPWQRIDEEEHALRASYQRFSALVAQREELQARLDLQRQRPLSSRGLLTAREPEVAMSQLMQLVSERLSLEPATGVACSVLNRVPQIGASDGPLIPVALSVDLECGIESLTGTLHRLESEPPYLLIDTLSIRRLVSQDTVQSSSGRLSVKMQVRGYLSVSSVVDHE
ncbi:type II secretion system protein GspM [Pseudomonas pergaminensis]